MQPRARARRRELHSRQRKELRQARTPYREEEKIVLDRRDSS
jgi:hypothetical protein